MPEFVYLQFVNIVCVLYNFNLPFVFSVVPLAGDASGPADLNVVAMAISGFTGDDRNALWREQCRSIGASLKNPYLRTLFAFLTIGSGESYDNTILVSYVFDC